MHKPDTGDEVTLRDVWRVMLHGRWLIVGLAGSLAALGLAYVLIAPPWYDAEVLLAPAEERSTEESITSQFGSLAGLAGISIGDKDSSEAIAIIQSRDFTRAFIQDFDLLPVLFADEWNPESRQWKSSDPEDWPDMREGVRYFGEKIRRVEEDRSTGLVTLTISWKDSGLAADWANANVRRLNATMRQRDLAEAQKNYEYLQKELGSTNIVTLQQSIGRLLDAELQKLMLARGNEEYAFRILDRAEPPQFPSRPRRVLIPILTLILGGILGIAVVTIRQSIAAPEAR
jgi:uncharacterized protein involved in exopolysaccharide biosynthesis